MGRMDRKYTKNFVDMKVICVDNNNYRIDVTVDNVYDVIDRDTDYYLITDDKKELVFYHKRYFETIEEYRNNQIDKVL